VLATVTWMSGGVFALAIVSFYGATAVIGQPQIWNQSLAHLYDPDTVVANVGIGVHFLCGTVLLLLGPLQLSGSLRRRVPAVHRWTGRTYASVAFLAGLGGTLYIVLKGTIGGTPMSVGFAIYGCLMMLAALNTYRHARGRDLSSIVPGPSGCLRWRWDRGFIELNTPLGTS
jgi:hypothetical protein